MSLNFNVGSGGTGRSASGCGGGCGAVFGVLFGLLLVPAGFYMVYYGEVKLVNHGVVFANTPLVPLEAAAKAEAGLTKFKGQPKGQFLRVERYDKPVVYWDTDIEEYQEERDSEGDVTREWNGVGGDTKWAAFTLGPIKITPDKANAVGEKTVFKGVKKRYSSRFDPNVSDSSPNIGDQRLELSVIDASSELIVLGQVQGQSCSGGSSFVVSALDEAATEQALRTEYKILYWVLKGGAGVIIWMGLLAIFGPLITLVGWVPLIGDRLTGAFAFAALAFSVFVVAVATFALKFLWLIALLAAVGLTVLIVKGIRAPRQRPLPTDASLPTVLPPPQ